MRRRVVVRQPHFSQQGRVESWLAPLPALLVAVGVRFVDAHEHVEDALEERRCEHVSRPLAWPPLPDRLNRHVRFAVASLREERRVAPQQLEHLLVLRGAHSEKAPLRRDTVWHRAGVAWTSEPNVIHHPTQKPVEEVIYVLGQVRAVRTVCEVFDAVADVGREAVRDAPAACQVPNILLLVVDAIRLVFASVESRREVQPHPSERPRAARADVAPQLEELGELDRQLKLRPRFLLIAHRAAAAAPSPRLAAPDRHRQLQPLQQHALARELWVTHHTLGEKRREEALPEGRRRIGAQPEAHGHTPALAHEHEGMHVSCGALIAHPSSEHLVDQRRSGLATRNFRVGRGSFQQGDERSPLLCLARLQVAAYWADERHRDLRPVL